MAAHHELIKRLNEDESLRDAILAEPTREGKQAVVRDAGLTVPDHHDVLQHVAGGSTQDDVTAGAIGLGAGGTVVVAAALAAAAL